MITAKVFLSKSSQFWLTRQNLFCQKIVKTFLSNSSQFWLQKWKLREIFRQKLVITFLPKHRQNIFNKIVKESIFCQKNRNYVKIFVKNFSILVTKIEITSKNYQFSLQDFL